MLVQAVDSLFLIYCYFCHHHSAVVFFSTVDRRHGWRSGPVLLLMALTAMKMMSRRQMFHTILRCAAKTRKLKGNGNDWSWWKPKSIGWRSWRWKRCIRTMYSGLWLSGCWLNLTISCVQHVTHLEICVIFICIHRDTAMHVVVDVVACLVGHMDVL